MMIIRSIAISLLAILFIGANVVLPQSSSAQVIQAPAKPMKIGVINIDRVQRDTKAGKSIRSQLNEERTKVDKENDRRRSNIREKEEQFKKQQAVLSDTGIVKLQEEYSKELRGYEAWTRTQSERLTRMARKAGEDLEEVVQKTIDEISTQGKFDLIFLRNALATDPGALDITDEVIKRVDQKMPTYKLKEPKTGQ